MALLFQPILTRVKVIMTDLKALYANRVQETIKPLFEKQEGYSLIFLTSSSDMGVVRNNGRNGAKYAPQSLLFHFKKMTQDNDLKNWRFSQVEVSDQSSEEKNFIEAQRQERDKIKEINLFDHDFICHIGGGHDHVYPLVSALNEKFSKVIVINIDAHADTRTDNKFHSGTPFRQLDREIENLTVFQLGLHPYSNSFSTLTKLKREMPILWKNEIDTQSIEKFFKSISEELTQNTLVVFSLDADALTGNIMPGVSAVNSDGLNLDQLKIMMNHYLEMNLSHPPIMGLYELNPVYDQLSGLSMNTAANFIFHSLKKFKGLNK